MPQQLANAYPKKRFFIEMFTKDISMEECILDLIDNSIDGLIRSKALSPKEISKSIFSGNGATPKGQRHLPTIDVRYSQTQIEIADTCGGIDLNYALTEAFNFGHSVGWSEGHLGVYGIGLKRAVFKLGDRFSIESHTTENGFSCSLTVSKWLQNDANMADWRIPLTAKQPPKGKTPGTKITVSGLHEEVRLRMKDGMLATSLEREISTTYAFFLEQYVRVTLNGRTIQPFDIPLARAKSGKVSFEKLEPRPGVIVRIYASVSAADLKGRWVGERAGWYVACNGRLVLHADQSDISGWGVSPTPKYHPKFRQFIGLVFFEADDPHSLPWTTTKRGLNRESSVYLRIRNKMAVAAEPVLSYLSDLYAATPDDEGPTDKEIARSVTAISVGAATGRKTTQFTPPKKERKKTTRVQYDVDKAELELVQQHLRKKMSAMAVGRHTFDYFLKQEGLK